VLVTAELGSTLWFERPSSPASGRRGKRGTIEMGLEQARNAAHHLAQAAMLVVRRPASRSRPIRVVARAGIDTERHMATRTDHMALRGQSRPEQLHEQC
jgi:hypothetical protein